MDWSLLTTVLREWRSDGLRMYGDDLAALSVQLRSVAMY